MQHYSFFVGHKATRRSRKQVSRTVDSLKFDIWILLDSTLEMLKEMLKETPHLRMGLALERLLWKTSK